MKEEFGFLADKSKNPVDFSAGFFIFLFILLLPPVV